MKLEEKNIIIKGRINYTKIFESVKGKYSCCLIFEKDEEVIENLKNKIKFIFEENKKKLKGKSIERFFELIHDGDIEKEEDENYKNKMFINASSYIKPDIISIKNGELMEDKEEIKDGDHVALQLSFSFYDNEFNTGIKCNLNNVLFIEKGEEIKHRISGFDAFKDYLN